MRTVGLRAALVGVVLAGLAAVPLRAAPIDTAPSNAPSAPAPCIPRPASMPATLLVADVNTARGFSVDEQLMFAALQGLVNRTGPQIYLEGESGDTTSATWLAEGAVPLATHTVEPYDLLARFSSALKGLVVWDPGLATDTQNVATTIAGVDDLLPVSPSLATKLTAAGSGLPIAVDLRANHFTSRDQAYDWALANFGPPHTRVLSWLGGDRHGLRDLVVGCRGFVFQANPETDTALVHRILAAYPAGTPVFGYPCLDDAISKSSGVPVCEPAGVGEISSAGKFLIPSDLGVNLSVHAAFPPRVQRPPWDDRVERPDPSNTYVTFIVSDGDNLGYNEEYLRGSQWVDPARGSLPIGISVSPWLGVYAPRLYDFYVRGLRGTEALVSGPSGGGYLYPGLDPDLESFLAQTKRLFDLDGLRAVWILDNGYAYSPSPVTVDRYVQALHPSGIFADYFGWLVPNPPATSFDRGVPVAHAVWGSCVADTVGRIQLAAATSPTRPAFVFVALNTWAMGSSSAAQVMQELGPGYVAVRPDRFVGLVKGAGLLGSGGPTAPALPHSSQPPSSYCVP